MTKLGSLLKKKKDNTTSSMRVMCDRFSTAGERNNWKELERAVPDSRREPETISRKMMMIFLVIFR